MLRRLMVLLMTSGLLASLAGCTVYPEKRPATLASTTSAEQSERLYWKAIQKGDWQQAAAVQGPSVLFATRTGAHVTGAQWLDWLKQNPPKEYLIGEVQLRPQGADMVVSYVAAITGTGGGSATQAKSATPGELAVVSVWQQTGKPGRLLMVAHSETPRAPSAR